MPKRMKGPTLTLSLDEVSTAKFAIAGAIDDHKAEIRNPVREHGPAESAMALVDLEPLYHKVEQFLVAHHPGYKRSKPHAV